MSDYWQGHPVQRSRGWFYKEQALLVHNYSFWPIMLHERQIITLVFVILMPGKWFICFHYSIMTGSSRRSPFPTGFSYSPFISLHGTSGNATRYQIGCFPVLPIRACSVLLAPNAFCFHLDWTHIAKPPSRYIGRSWDRRALPCGAQS